MISKISTKLYFIVDRLKAFEIDKVADELNGKELGSFLVATMKKNDLVPGKYPQSSKILQEFLDGLLVDRGLVFNEISLPTKEQSGISINIDYKKTDPNKWVVKAKEYYVQQGESFQVSGTIEQVKAQFLSSLEQMLKKIREKKTDV